MNVEYIGRNVQIADETRNQVEQKLNKLLRYLDEPVEGRFTLDLEKHRHRHIAELHLTHRHGVLQATEETNGEIADAVHTLFDKVEEQARRAHEKRVDERRRADRNTEPNAPEP
jgi:putative sigma-54 modulation protein